MIQKYKASDQAHCTGRNTSLQTRNAGLDEAREDSIGKATPHSVFPLCGNELLDTQFITLWAQLLSHGVNRIAITVPSERSS